MQNVHPSDGLSPATSTRHITARPLTWLITGTLVGAGLLLAQAIALGGEPAHLLGTGNSPLASYLSESLGVANWDPDFTHDGHRFFAIAEDPWGLEVPSVMERPTYRYQRILFPAIASGFGAIDGRALLWSMLAISALSLGIAAAAVSRLAGILSLNSMTPIVVVANPAFLLSVKLVTADTLAFGLFALGVAWWLEHRRLLAAIFLAAACLTKEVFVAGVVGLALWEWVRFRQSRKVATLLASTLPTTLWSIWLIYSMGGGFEGGSNFMLPLVGIWEGLQTWSMAGLSDRLYTTMALFAVVGGFLVLRHPRPLWFWLCVPWAAMGVVSSHWIWGFGNNALRVLSPLTAFVMMAVIDRLGQTKSLSTTPTSP